MSNYIESTPMRKKLYGNTVTAGNFAKEVAKLYLDGVSTSNIATKLGFKEVKSIKDLKRLAVELNFLATNESGRAIKPEKSMSQKFAEFSEKNPILEDKKISDWYDSMKFQGHTGKGRKSSSMFLNKITQICNHVKINPEQLCYSLIDAETYAMVMYKMLESGEADIIRITTNEKKSMAARWYPYRMAIRGFIISTGIAIPRGRGGILSGKVVGHAQYADLHFTSGQHEQAEKYAIEKFGIDSDFYRCTFFGIDTGARKEAILTADLEWTESKEDGETTFFMKVFESKIEHIKGGIVDKYISRENFQKSLLAAKKKGYTKLFDSKNIAKQKFYLTWCKELKEMYRSIGITHHYYFERPVHSLKHISSQYWLELTDWDLQIVSDVVGTSIKELQASYGAMPPETKWKKLKSALHKMRKK